MQLIRSFYRSKVRGNERLLWLIPIVDFALLLVIVFVPMGKKVEAVSQLPIYVEQAMSVYRQQAEGGASRILDYEGKDKVVTEGAEAVSIISAYLNDEKNTAGAIDLLASIGGAESRQTLLAFLESKATRVPPNLAAALVKVGNDEFVQELAARYQNRRGVFDSVILDALEQMGAEGQKWAGQLRLE